jgi:hypothetical protein
MIELSELFACATCRSDPGSTINQATNGAVFVMLGVMTVVFGGFMAVAVSFIRKQRAIGRHQAERERLAGFTSQSA